MTGEPSPASESTVRVRLYLAGESPNSVTARANLHDVLAKFPHARIVVEIIDVLQHPERGLDNRVLVTPMLVKTHPLPERRILGNLRNRSMLLAVLGIVEPP